VRRALAALALLLGACASRGSLLVVDVEAAPPLAGVARVHATVSALGASRVFDLTPPSPVATPFTFGVGLPPSSSGGAQVHVDCFDATGAPLGSGDGATTLAGERSDLTITIGGAIALDGGALDGTLDGGADLLAAGDLATDGAPLDAATADAAPDMNPCVLASPAQTAWVDPNAGADNPSHGAGPGACAFRSITYALAHATGRINLATATYQANETFPLVLAGAQILDGDPTQSGARAQIVGSGQVAGISYYGAVFLTGTANQLLNCDVSLPPTVAFDGHGHVCIQVTTSGAHVIDHCKLHNCYVEAIELDGRDGITISNNTIFDDPNSPTTNNVAFCVQHAGNNVTIKTTSCAATSEYLSGCGTGLAGCGNTFTMGTQLSDSCAIPSGFTAACPP
jgi:hypothetical protein